MAERSVLDEMSRRARQAKPCEVSRVVYQGAFARVIWVIACLVTGALILDSTMFVCLVVSYVSARMAMLFIGIWRYLIRRKRLREQKEP